MDLFLLQVALADEAIARDRFGAPLSRVEYRQALRIRARGARARGVTLRGGRGRTGPRALDDVRVIPPAPTIGSLRPCLGCGERSVEGRHYCKRCRVRNAQGLPLDLEAFPTIEDARRAHVPGRLHV